MIIRRAEHVDRFTIVDNALIEDTRMSFRARGLLVYLLSRPAGWRCDHRQLAKLTQEGERAVRTALAEIRICGYSRSVREQDKTTGRWRTDVEVSEKPVTEWQKPPPG